MLHALLALGLLASPELYGGNLLYPDLEDYVSGSGAAVGLFAMQVCTQTADDTTPGVGVGYGPLGLGCNIIVTSDANTGATAITTFDGIPPSVPGTPGSILYVIGPATAANPTTIADAGNFELEVAWSAPLTGSETRVLVLECIAADTFVQVTRQNGPRHFDDILTAVSSLIAATGDEYAVDISYTTNKLTSGDDYGLRIRQTDTTSPATSYLLDIGVGSSSQFYITNTGLMTLYGSSWTDSMQWYHDETDAYYKTDDGNFIFQTDEGTNTSTVMELKPKGTSEVTSIGLYDTDGQRLFAYTAADRAYIESQGGALGLQVAQVQDVLLWESIASGNPSLTLYGWNTAGSDLESTELTMDDTNDEFLIRAANSVNHEGITVELGEANQLFRVRGSDGAVDFSSSDTALLAVNPATFNSTIDAESYMALGNGSALVSNKTLVIDRDFSDASDGEALSVTGSQIEVTAGTGDIHHTMMNPGGTEFSTAATVHGYATTLNLLEPNITLSDGATVTHAATMRIVDAPTEGVTSNWALWVDAGDVKIDEDLTVDGTLTAGAITMAGNLDMAGNDIINPDDIYSEAIGSDATPRTTVITSQPVYAGIGAANTAAANLVIAAGSGGENITGVTQAGTGGDTIKFKGTLNDGTIMDVTLTEGVDYTCVAAASDIECVCNIYTAVEGHGTLGPAINTVRTDGTCSDEKLFFGVEPGVLASLDVVNSDNVNTVMTHGTDGSVIISGNGGAPTALSIRLRSDASTGLYSSGGTAINLIGNGASAGEFTTGTATLPGNLIVGAASDIRFSGSTEMTAGGTDGQLIIWNNAQTEGVLVDPITGTDTLTLADENGNPITLEINSATFAAEVNFSNNAAAATFGAVGTDADVVLAFDAVTAQGSITYMEDEDRFDFDNDVDVVADLTAGTIASDAGLSGVNLTTTGRRVITPGDQELSAAETLTITSSEMTLYSDGGAVVSTADPALTNGTADGEIICVMGTSDANTIQWQDETDNAGSTLELSGDVAFTMGLGDRLCLRWYATGSKWYETSRSNN
ncbi:MAG: hypothetical protein ACYTEX_23285 [Planctomycetota bacterium]|jgi:hypothetical protein